MSPVVISEANTHESSTDFAEGSDVPNAFICPLTMNVMVDPMASKYGHNFERKAILEWLDADSNVDSLCPMTRQPLFPSMLISNARLRCRIRNWRVVRGEKIDFDSEQESGYKATGSQYEYDFDGGDLTESETEEETEIDAEIDAEVAAIVETMRRIAEHHRLSQQAQSQAPGDQQQDTSSSSSKKSRKSRSLLGRFGLKSKR